MSPFPLRAATLVRGLVLVLLFCPVARADVVLEDDAGRHFAFAAPPERIITLAPHLAELVFAVGGGERLVGTTEWSNHPPAAREVPRIGDGFRIDAERILALQPDVVLAWGGGTPALVIEELRGLDLAVAVLTPRDLASIERHLLWLGELTGKRANAERAARTFRDGLSALRAEFAQREPVSVFYQISSQPLFTVGAGHTISELIAICGGRNIFSDLDRRAHAVTREAVIARDPDVIVSGQYAGGEDELAQWRDWKGMTAVRTGNLFALDGESVARPTPGLLDGGRALCTLLERARANLKAILKSNGQDLQD